MRLVENAYFKFSCYIVEGGFVEPRATLQVDFVRANDGFVHSGIELVCSRTNTRLQSAGVCERSALCRSRRELSNAYFLAKFRFDTADNEPCKVCRIP